MSGAGVAVLGLVIAGVVVALSGGGSDGSDSEVRDAGSLFAADSAAKADGLDQELNTVAASGTTMVAAGGVRDLGGYRTQFLTSADGGKTFKLGSVRKTNGEAPAIGEVPRHIAGRTEGWVALGRSQGGVVVWTSGDGQSWVREQDSTAAAFGRKDRIARLAGSTAGFVAVGGTSAKGDFSDVAPALWQSSDGKTWQRFAGPRLGMDPKGGTVELTNVAVGRDALLVQGVRRQKRKRPLNAVWRSGDGGRTWTEVNIPAPPGTIGLTITAAPSGFVAAREILQKGNAHSVAFTSFDGNRWTKAGELKTDGYRHMWQLSGNAQDMTAMVNTDDKVVVLRSRDAATWQPAGELDVPAGRTMAAASATESATVLVGRDLGDDVNSVLVVQDAQGQQIQSRLPAPQADKAVQAATTVNGKTVAVGSSSGDAAIWTSGDGATWTRADVKSLARSGRQRLTDVVSGASGWLAVGVDAATPSKPVVAVSSDGSAWQAADGDKMFEPRNRTALITYAAAAGANGYVVVGEDGLAPAAWFSSDLKTWTRATGVTDDDLAGDPGANRWMRGVTSGSFGYVAVGGMRDPSVQNAPPTRPGVWTSADGQKWAARQLPLPAGASEGWLRSVTAKGNSLVAVGVGSSREGSRQFAFLSPDGGRSWQEVKLPESSAVPNSAVKVITTPKGFLVVGAKGRVANGDVIAWTSADGRTWKKLDGLPKGLGGDGDQELTSLTVIGGDLVGIGRTTDSQGDQPILWRRAVP